MAKNPLHGLSVKDGLDDSSLLRTLIDSLPEHIFVKDADSRYVVNNVAHVKALGAASPEEVAGKSDFDFYPEELAEQYQAGDQEIISSGQPLVDGEEPSVDEEGNERWHSTTKVPLRDGNGKIVGIVGISWDVTDRKQAEEALRESEERFRNLTEAAFEGIAISENGKILEANQAFADMYGYEVSEVRGMSALEFQAPETRDEVWQKISSGFSESYESVGLKKDGTTFDVEIRGRTTWYGDRFVRVTAIRDITERKQAEEKLRESEKRFRALVQNASDIVTILEADGTFRYKSPAVERLLGYKDEEILGTKLFDYIHPEDVEYVRRTFATTLKRPGIHPPVQLRFRHADGSWRHVEAIRNNLLEDPDLQGIVVNTRDITERKEAEEALKESEERYRAVVEQSVEGIWLFDPDTKQVLESNTAFQEMLGYNAEELREMTNYDFVAHSRENIDSTVQRLLEERRGFFGERKYRRKDGTVLNVEVSGTVIPYKGREVMCSIARDLTERKEAEEKLKESERHFRSLIQNALDPITIIDEDSTIRYESPAVERILGYRPEERVGKNAFDFAHPDDREWIASTFAEVLDKPGQVQPSVEFRLRHKDGSWRHMEATRTNLLEDPAVKGVVSNSRDITERKQAEEKLRESEERFRTAFEDAPIGVALVGLNGRHIRVNRALCEMLGYSEEELLEKTPLDFTHPDDLKATVGRMRRVLEGGPGSYTIEKRYVHADGQVVWILSSVSLIQDSQGNPSHFVCLHQDITERKVLEEWLRYWAFHDSLTELPNRALFLDRLGRALTQVSQESGPVAMLLVDLNHFKLINDSLGHDAGNTVLVGVAERLKNSVRPGDTVGRLFGDEFVILLEAPSGVQEACRVAERIQECLQEPFDIDGRKVFVSPSIGVALGESTEDEPKEVLRHADLAMYTAKRHGRSQYEVYSPSMDVRVQERMDLENELRRAVEREELEVHYQPIIELRTGEISGFEALARWRHPERGLLDAEEFILTTEETGLIRPIGRWVLEEACRQAREWCERCQDKTPLMSVNFSAGQFSHQADLIPKVLSDTGLAPSGLQLELTERAVMDDVEFSVGKLKKLKDRGVSLAIDDYGMGYSCLYYLRRMPVDYLKIDQVFVAGFGETQGDEAIVSGTITLAHALGLKVVAEGVETADQLAKLKELGCDLAQGYYFAEPLASEAAERLLVGDVPW